MERSAKLFNPVALSRKTSPTFDLSQLFCRERDSLCSCVWGTPGSVTALLILYPCLAWLWQTHTQPHARTYTHTQSDISVLSCGSSLTVFLASLPGLPLYLLSVCDLSLTPVTPQLGSSRCALLGFVEIPLLSQ